MNILLKLSLVSLLLIIGCAPKEPEGPAEAIGKGIDQITRGLESMAPEETDRRNRYDDRYRDDPYYDRYDEDRYYSDSEYCRDFPERCRDRYRY